MSNESIAIKLKKIINSGRTLHISSGQLTGGISNGHRIYLCSPTNTPAWFQSRKRKYLWYQIWRFNCVRGIKSQWIYKTIFISLKFLDDYIGTSKFKKCGQEVRHTIFPDCTRFNFPAISHQNLKSYNQTFFFLKSIHFCYLKNEENFEIFKEKIPKLKNLKLVNFFLSS